ncbi:replicative DNA helicase [Nocardiopsis valliformis]|uniref:replicative DNA helicase n=1 Tax=Nocardiopsis valliformis TaxID=239974 RepID=UPI000346E6C3|nr:replicative DNA helicase [Nocardiopsis valliformis]
MTDETRMPPHNIQAEQSVLGGMLISADAAVNVMAMLTADHFYRPAHQLIYTAICDLLNRAEPVDAVSVEAELTRCGEAVRVGGAPYLHTLTEVIPTAANATYYAKIVRDRALLRRLVEVGTRAAQLGYLGEGEALDVVDRIQGEIMSLTQGTTTETGTRADGLMQLVVDGAESRAKRGPGTLVGLPSGFADLDALTSGFTPGQLVIIGARPSVGKSTLALDVARANAIGAGHPTAFFSLEMGEEELGQRLISAQGKIPLHIIKDSSLMTEDDWARMGKASLKISEAPLIVHDKIMMLSAIRAEIRRLHRTEGVRLVVVDYLQLVDTDGKKENRTQEVGEISRALKLLAKELGITIIALSQLNRGSEQRQDKRPMLSELRESGSLEQDADMVILIYREDVHDKDSPRGGEADLMVVKHRNGSTCDVTVAFQGHYSRFVDMAPG